jgi:hypothetical protein
LILLLDLALEVLALNKVRNIVLVLTLLGLLHVLVALGELSEGSEGVGAKLVQDAGDELGELLVLTVAVDGESVVRDSGVNLGSSEVDDVAIRLEHVNLLNGLDRLGAKLLQGRLELLVVGAGPGGRTLHLSPRSSLATNSGAGAELLEAFLNVLHCDIGGYVKVRGGFRGESYTNSQFGVSRSS